MLDSIIIYDSYGVNFGDIFELAKINGFKIYEESFNKWNGKLVLGGMRVNKIEKIIIVNFEISNKMKNFIIAHSMAHYFLNPSSEKDFETIEILGETALYSNFHLEKEINKLACELLISKEILKNEIYQYRTAIKNSRILNGIVSDLQIINKISDKYLIPTSVLMFLMDE